jgi:hypothetical protein
MIESIKRINRIVDEVSTFFMNKMKKDLDIQIFIKSNDSEYTITFTLKGIKISKSELEEIKDSLSIPRQRDAEEYYWQLNGSNESEKEFDLIGMMIDKYNIDISEDCIILTLIRKK